MKSSPHKSTGLEVPRNPTGTCWQSLAPGVQNTTSHGEGVTGQRIWLWPRVTCILTDRSYILAFLYGKRQPARDQDKSQTWPSSLKEYYCPVQSQSPCSFLQVGPIMWLEISNSPQFEGPWDPRVWPFFCQLMSNADPLISDVSINQIQ